MAPDLAHNALSLVLSRPFSRGEYVLGKLLVLLALLSAVTWIPGLLLVLLQGSLAGWGWVQANSHLAWALFAGSWLWILLVSLLALALSVVLRWRPVATGAVFAIFIVGEGFGHAVADIAETRWGHLVSLKTLVTTVWADLFGPSRTISRDAARRAASGHRMLARPPGRDGTVALAPDATGAAGRGLAMSAVLSFDNVSKFYGDVLGVNRIDLELEPGIIGLVGPNGSGKTTLMNLAAGLLKPTRGSVRLFGESPFERRAGGSGRLGYCTQFDTFPRGMNGFDFVERYLRLWGLSRRQARAGTERALDTVGMTDAAAARIAGYSKGMKQRIKLAQAIAHEPEALILDEPLNGLDPLARAEVLALLRTQASRGRAVLVSSHILHEVDDLADRVVLIHGGYIVAEGAIEGVREELAAERPIQVLVRCTHPAALPAVVLRELPPQAASRRVVEARLDDDGTWAVGAHAQRPPVLPVPEPAGRRRRARGRSGDSGRRGRAGGVSIPDPRRRGGERRRQRMIETIETTRLAVGGGRRRAQLAAIVGLELKKTLLRTRALLAAAGRLPADPGAAHPGAARRGPATCRRLQVAHVYSVMFQTLNLRVLVFFGCAAIFGYLIRGEMLERSLHFYLLTPIERPLLLFGKYLAGLLVAIGAFSTSTARAAGAGVPTFGHRRRRRLPAFGTGLRPRADLLRGHRPRLHRLRRGLPRARLAGQEPDDPDGPPAGLGDRSTCSSRRPCRRSR